LRIGTWNLEKYPLPTSDKGACVTAFLHQERADIWLFTEVNAGWATSHGRLVTSPARSYGREQDRWAGIQTRLPITQLMDGGEGPAAAEEALCLARVELPDSAGSSSVLVACSVLPWGGAGQYWPGLPPKFLNDQAEFVLGHHAARIHAARNEGEPVIWGGDFNQQLRPTPPERVAFGTAGTVPGIARLLAAFDRFELQVLTADAEHLDPAAWAIDHLAVSRSMVRQVAATVKRPTCPDGRRLSDHAAYIAEIEL
jgi:hypothetical protein